MNTPPPLLVIAGPTASGKSDFSIRCAQSLDGEILSVDSVQIYQGLDIGSAKVSTQQRSAVVHHLLDIVPPDAGFNVAQFLKSAQLAIADMRQRKKSCVVCAGTTLYLTALLHGLVDAPAQDENYRRSLREKSDLELHSLLAHVDPSSAQRLHVHDRVRVSRALETIEVTGKTMTELHAAHAYKTLQHAALIIVMCWGRDELYSRINQRSRAIVQGGLVDETRAILSRSPGALQALRTLGYAQACDYLDGRLTEQDLIPAIAMHTRRYAKRQMTYWRNEPLKRGWSARPRASEPAVELPISTPKGRGRAEKGFRVLSLDHAALLKEIKARLDTLGSTVEVWYVDAAALSGS